MRILHVVNFFDPNVGYTEYYLAKKQLELGLDVRVVCSNYPIQSGGMKRAGLAVEDGISVVRLKSSFNFRGNTFLFDPFSLAKVIKDYSPDLIHCHGLLSSFSQEVLILKRAFKYRVVGDLITGISPFASTLLLSLKRFFNFSIFGRVDELFACNEAVEKFLVKALGVSPSKVHFIPLGADVELFKPDQGQRGKTRKLLGLLPEDVVAIHTGKFLPSKGIHDLLVASKPIIEQYNNFKMILVGDGLPSYNGKLEFLIKKLGIKNNVLIVKTVHRTELPKFYNAADFAVWPGTFSISIIEAMACGLPIVIAKSDWTSHYLDYENGYSFKAGDTGNLCSILLRLVENPALRNSMGAGSQKIVENRLNWDVITQDYIAVYQKSMDK